MVILAGGESARMGRDKAFLLLRGRPFISVIVDELTELARDILVSTGSKDHGGFARALPGGVILVSDGRHLANPMGGMLSGLGRVRCEYAAVVACDLPLVRVGVVRHLLRMARGHSAAVPRWENGDLEPLCAVYHAKEAVVACQKAIAMGKMGPRSIIDYMDDVRYAEMAELRAYDEGLVSFLNVNDEADYARAKQLAAEDGRRIRPFSDWSPAHEFAPRRRKR